MARVKLEAESGQIRRATQDLERLNNTGERTDRTVQMLRRSFIALGGAAALRKAIQTSNQFSQAIADLSAITGAAGADLQFYRDRAAEIGRTTSLSASQAADAFKLIASAQPDLLNSAEALAAVTQEAVTLAEATGMSLPAAATALGGAINQFQLSATQANEVINILAASSQRGTVGVESITESLVNAGAAANALGLDFAETVAGLQALARANITGARAGTALNQVLLGLERTNDQQLMPSVNGLVDALDNLAARQLSNNEIIKQFGREALPAVQALLAQRDAARSLNTEIRGTNVAAEQASTRMDTLTGDIKQLQSALEGLTIGVFGQDVEELNRSLVQAATGGINAVTEGLGTVRTIAEAVAIVLGARMVGAATASATSFILAQREAIRYQATLASMAGIASTTAIRLTTLGVAARGAAGAMAFLGGPAGLALIAAYGLYRFVDANRATTQAVRDTTQSVEDAFDPMQRYIDNVNEAIEGRIGGMSRNQMQERFDEVSKSLERADRVAARANERFGENSLRAQQAAERARALREEYNQLGGALGSFSTSLDRQTEKFREVADSLALQVLELSAGAEAAERYRLLQELGNDATEEEIANIDALLQLRGQLRESLEAEEEARRAAIQAQQEQDRINQQAEGIIASLQSEEDQIRASYERRREIVMQSTIYTEEEKKQVILDLNRNMYEELSELDKGYWEQWLEGAQNNLTNFDEMAGNTIENFSRSFGDAFADVILDSESATDALRGMMGSIARSTIAALGEMAAQWLAYQAVQMLVGKTTQAGAAGAKTLEAQAAVQLAGINAFASTAAIPVVGPALAPGAMAAAIAATTPSAVAVGALMSGSVAARRNGGSFMGGQDLLVGEAGPEIVRMPQGGRVTPYNDLMREAKGGDTKNTTNEINLSFTVNAIDTQGMEEAISGQRDVIFNLVASALREQGREL